MNPFDANERHRYIIESGGNPVSSADGKEKEIWVNSINIDIDTPIYRYMKWEYLQQFYSEPMHEWILVRPCLWQDKFEQFIFKCDRVHSIKVTWILKYQTLRINIMPNAGLLSKNRHYNGKLINNIPTAAMTI